MNETAAPKSRRPIFAKGLFALVMVLLTLYLVEILLTAFPATFIPHTLHHADLARHKGIPYDTRTKLEVMDDLIASGTNAVIGFSPYLALPHGLKTDQMPVFPLGGAANRWSVFSNESGVYTVFKTGPYGFNNPPEAFDSPADLVLIGDSLIHGYTVPPGTDPGALLRAKGRKTVNLSAYGIGPLIQLGILTEFAASLKPNTVLWFFYESNDLVNLGQEKESDLLVDYMVPGFSQSLMTRQAEVDALILANLDQRIERQRNRKDTVKRKPRLPPWTKLWNVRNLFRRPATRDQGMDAVDPLFFDILGEAKKRVEAWEGDLVFVYLPAWTHNSPHRRIKQDLLKGVSETGLRVLDFSDVLEAERNPEQVFPLGIVGHYPPELNQRLMAFLIRNLDLSVDNPAGVD